ncbi:MAG: APC family permease [Nitrososphaerota archaeon]|nr:APC family permease [Nitrososphaerota archaeon]MDG6930715.1 APC family permease [Nitrososphaerota archaeon]
MTVRKLELKESSLKPYLVVAQAISSIAPLGSVSAYLTFAMTYSLVSTTLAGILGVIIYFMWVLIGYRYSKYIASAGGIYDFARSGGGETVGRISGWLYWISYAVYLPSSTAYITGIVLTSFFKLSPMVDDLIEFGLAFLLIGFMISGLKVPFYYALVSSTIEGILIAVLGLKVLSVTGLSMAPLAFKVPVGSFFGGALGVGFVMVGGGVTFFLGYEAEGKGRTVGRSYILAYIVASALVLFASYFEIAGAGYTSSGVNHMLSVIQYPGFYLASMYLGNGFALAILVFTVSSLIGSAMAAYVALARLTHVMLHKSMLISIVSVGAFFMVINLAGIAFGNLTLLYLLSTEASLVTLYASHAITAFVFPLFTKKINARKFYDLILAAASVILMVYGLYSNIIPYEFPLSTVGLISIAVGMLIGIIAGMRLVRGSRNRN